MPRDIPVGNGRLLVCFDSGYNLRDLYFPHVGQENHLGGNPCRFGVWADGVFSWVGEDWKRELRYESEALVAAVLLYSEELQLLISSRDAVDFHEDVYIREVTVENLKPETRDVRLFFCQNFDISGNSVGDTAAFDPASGGIVHYKGSRYFLANALSSNNEGLSQFAVGQKGAQGKEGTWRDAEDGRLSGNPVAQGSVDSALGLSLHLAGYSTAKLHYWLCVAEDWEAARRIDSVVKAKGPAALLHRTADFWRLWVRKERAPVDGLPTALAELYCRSLLVLRTHADSQGAILAANDSDVVLYNRDTYSYMWPRDGALAAHAFDLAGYPMVAQRFYEFAARTIEPEGYLLHKYNPDGSLASSWHPWYENGKAQLPIQEDGTALVLWALWRHFVIYRDIEFIKPLYKPLIKRAADFLCSYRDRETGLPSASYDLWEERRGVFSFTVGAVFGGITAASLFCRVFGETEREENYRRHAAEIRDAASTHLWKEELGRFCRGILVPNGSSPEVDYSLDSSLWGLFAFGLYKPTDPRIKATMEALRKELWVKTGVGGMARYKGDYYHRNSGHRNSGHGDSGEIPGNPWIICTLWLADYLIENASTEEDFSQALELLKWVEQRSLPSGVLPEQVDPHSGRPLSVSPLAWSHAAFITTIHRLSGKMSAQATCPECGADLPTQEGEDWLNRLFTETCRDIYGICKTE